MLGIVRDAFHLIGHLCRALSSERGQWHSPGPAIPVSIRPDGIRQAEERTVSWLAANRSRRSQQVNARRSSDMFRSPVPLTRIRTLAAGVALALLQIGVMFAMTTAAQAAPAPRLRAQ